MNARELALSYGYMCTRMRMHHYSPTLSMEDEVEEALDKCIRQISDDVQQEADVVIGKCSYKFPVDLYWEHLYFIQSVQGNQQLIGRSGIWRRRHIKTNGPVRLKDCRSLFTKPSVITYTGDTRTYFKIADRPDSVVEVTGDMDVAPLYKGTMYNNSIFVYICHYLHV